MVQKIRSVLPVVIILLVVALAGAWYLWGRETGNPNGVLSATGTVEAVEVVVAPEISGRVTDVLAAKGDSVKAGQPLLRLDDALLQAQRHQAEAAKSTADAGLDTARAALDTARLQYSQILETARLADAAARSKAWTQTQPSDFDQPGWYFTKQELIAAMQKELEAARQALDDERNNLQSLLDSPKYSGIAAAEQRLTQARAAFLVAKDVLDRANAALDNEHLQKAAQDRYDDAKQELDDAQQAYDDLLDTKEAKELRKARGRVRAAEERYDTAIDRLARLHTGEDSLAVQVADAVIKQALYSATQAEKSAAQAQTLLDSIDTQIGKLTVYAPADGVVMDRNIEPGEMALAGSSALVIGRLDRLTITVYIPEDRYGEIRLGQKVDIAVDSFPGETFSGSVSRIAERAEFTPRNVQTDEGRRTTVFAVEITIDQPESKLKPGMPADVTFKD